MNCLNKEESHKDFFQQIIMARGEKRGPSIRTKYRAEIFVRLESFKLKHMFQPLLRGSVRSRKFIYFYIFNGFVTNQII